MNHRELQCRILPLLTNGWPDDHPAEPDVKFDALSTAMAAHDFEQVITAFLILYVAPVVKSL